MTRRRLDLPDDWEGQVARAYAVFEEPDAEAEFWREVGWNPDEDYPELSEGAVESPKKMLERIAGELNHGAVEREPAITPRSS